LAALSAINMLKSLENPVLGTLEPGFPDPSSLRSPEAQLLLGNYYQIRAKTAKKEGSDAQSLSYFRFTKSMAEDLIASKRCRERDLVVAMIVQRLIAPCSKLATTREWHDTTLSQELGVVDASEDDLYVALDWLRQRQERIENKLAKKHLHEGAVVLYDLTSTRDPVAKAEPSESAKRKKATQFTSQGGAVQSFQSLMKTLGTRCRNKCRAGNNNTHAIFYELTEPTPFQVQIFNLLGLSP